MTKMIKVADCEECPYMNEEVDGYEYPETYYECLRCADDEGDYMRIPEDMSIPDWCPLEDVKE